MPITFAQRPSRSILSMLVLSGSLLALTSTSNAQQALLEPQQAALKAAGKTRGGKVSVLAVWGGNELENFRSVVKPFEEATGIKVEYEGTRDINAVLTTRVQGGNAPDIAGLPGPEQLEQFAKDGKVVPLNLPTLRRDYAKGWIDLASSGGKLYGVFTGASVKGLVWYNPKQYSGPKAPKTWAELSKWTDAQAAQGKTAWCVGVESGAASGWAGTDWIENILLRQSGPTVYDQWYSGKLAWTSSEVKSAFQAYGSVVTDPKKVFGGPTAVLTTNFGDAGTPLFTKPAGCSLLQQASFIADFFVKNTPGLKPVEDFDFFGFPNINSKFSGAIEASGDLFGMFRDTPQARALMNYLITPEAQTIWVKTGQIISPNKRVAAGSYPNALAGRASKIIATAKVVRFDASDLMPAAMNAAFWKAILEYTQNPGRLDVILTNLDTVRKESYK